MIIKKVHGLTENQIKRVAAYCRVSTALDSQQDSFDTQMHYYTTLITENPAWELVDIYADEGRSGTSAKRRPEFMRMMQDAFDGKIDLILTKSISRFSRNVVDCQMYVRELKSRGIEVRFERENISSMDATADFIFSILATVAQEESRSISENVRWRYAKNFEQGVYLLGNNRILGYDTNQEGELVPNKDAWIVKRVFEDFLAGMNYTEIAADLEAAGARRLRSDNPFTAGCVSRMLHNEYYVGDMLLQKEAPHDYLTKRPQKNIEYTSYYLQGNHEGIIDRETWDQVKAKLDATSADRAEGLTFNCTQTHFLYGKVFCEVCGAPYTRRTFSNRSGSHYKAWNCRERQKGTKGNGCKSPIVREEVLLDEITAVLGLESFDNTAFNERVERIMIAPDRIHVQLRKPNKPESAEYENTKV